MAAMKPRTGDGPMEVTKEGRGIIMRVPVEGGGRLVVELNARRSPGTARVFQGRRRLTQMTNDRARLEEAGHDRTKRTVSRDA